MMPTRRVLGARLGSDTAMLQLFGTLILLGPLAALAVLRWPAKEASAGPGSWPDGRGV